MAKGGRKLTTSRSERYLGSFGYSEGQGTVTEESELGEEEVWSMVGENGSHGGWSPRGSPESNGGFGLRSYPHVPRGDRHTGGLSLAFDDPAKTASSRIVHQFRGQDSLPSPRGRHMATSAPVNVPDWSKIYRVDSVESLHDSDDDRDTEVVPPHEYARSRMMAANSVFEGVGRTLKGRDLSRVRDAVWSQTGFDG